MNRLQMNFDGREYDICITQGFDALRSEIAKLKPSKIMVVTDSNVSELYLKKVYTALEGICCALASVEFVAGEARKNLATVQRLYAACLQNGLDRKSVIIALGGGVVGDMAGFVAASYMRGIRYVQVPTTLLAQTDSSVGGKVGVDFDGYKNCVGFFKQPNLVYANAETLMTLPKREFAAGMGEVIKYGIIRDIDFLKYIYNNAQAILSLSIPHISHVLEVCCRIKAEIVLEDETEKGNRALLNFGHTIGHAVESAMDFTLLHGECVALGMIAALEIAKLRGNVTEEEMGVVIQLLEKFSLPTTVSGLGEDIVLSYLSKDKKMENGVLKFILPEKMGMANIYTDVTRDELCAGIQRILL